MSLKDKLREIELQQLQTATELANKQLAAEAQADPASIEDLKPLTVSTSDLDNGDTADAIEQSIKEAVNSSAFNNRITVIQIILKQKFGYDFDTNTGLLIVRQGTDDEILTEAVHQVQSLYTRSVGGIASVPFDKAKSWLLALKGTDKKLFNRTYDKFIADATQRVNTRFDSVNIEASNINAAALDKIGKDAATTLVSGST